MCRIADQKSKFFFIAGLKNPRKYLLSKEISLLHGNRSVSANFFRLTYGLGRSKHIIDVEGIIFKAVDTSLKVPRSVVL